MPSSGVLGVKMCVEHHSTPRSFVFALRCKGTFIWFRVSGFEGFGHHTTRCAGFLKRMGEVD